MDDVRYGLGYYMFAEGTQVFESQERFDSGNGVGVFLEDDMDQSVFVTLGSPGSAKSRFNNYP